MAAGVLAAIIMASTPAIATNAALAAPPDAYQEIEISARAQMAEPEIETSSIRPEPIGIVMRATHYGESYNGRTMGCSGAGAYWSDRLDIAAVGPGRYKEWPCGQQLRISGPSGSIVVRRTDSCPGCDTMTYGHEHEMIDLSEAGHAAVCGIGTCTVTVYKVEEE